MKYRTYPNTDIRVSEIGFGVWTLAAGWWGQFTDDEAVSLLHRAYDLGVTLFDSADSYGDGRGDRLLGRAFGDRRDRVVLTTKVGYAVSEGVERRGQQEQPHGDGPGHLRRAVEASLVRFGTDTLDVVSFHNAKATHVDDDTLWEMFERLRDEGKIRAWGATLGPSNGYLYEGLDLVHRRRVANLQLINNIFEPFPGQILTAAAEETGITGLQVRVPHASGLLEGRYTADTEFAKHDHRRHRPRGWLERGLQKLEAVRFLHEGRGMTMGQAALKWLLASPAVVTTLPNIYTVAQLEEFVAAPALPDLTDEDLRRIGELQATNFGVPEESMRFKGAPPRPGQPVHVPPYAQPADAYGSEAARGTARKLAG